jgi:ribonucleotide monophosphatase NagD (HAD superfamily)
MGLRKNEVLVVGDRIATDVRGALDFGLRSALVKTGEFDVKDLGGNILADYLFDSVQEILSLFD